MPTETSPSEAALPDLSQCEREPIHIPGAVQPHGVLLVLRRDDGRVQQASASVEPLLGLRPDQCLGRHWSELLAWEGDAPADDDAIAGPHPVVLPSAPAPRAWQAIVHRHDARVELVEIEPRPEHAHDGLLHAAYDLVQRFDRITTLDELVRLAARRCQALLGYDRVMVYRFDAEHNGEVIAEAVVPPHVPFIGLNYPASDIPAQARALYLRTRVRGIADVNYVPAPLVPELDPDDGRPVDLSLVALRSVSPVHIEYLRNMGVGATLVASIVVGGKLWGLVSCHHYASRIADSHMRRAAELIGRALGDRIATLESVRIERELAAFASLRERLLTSFVDAASIDTHLLADCAPELMDVVDADGIALFEGDDVVTCGRTPAPEALRRLRRGLLAPATQRARAAWSGIVHTDRLAQDFPDLAELAAGAAGALLIPFDPTQRSAVLWLRQERVRTVRWGGNPHLAKLPDTPGARLSPRKSFEEWQETVAGTSRPWRAEQLEAAQALRLLVEVIERKRLQHLAVTIGEIGDGLDRGALFTGIAADGAPGAVLFCSEAFRDALGGEVAFDPAQLFDSALRARLASQPLHRSHAIELAGPRGAIPASATRLEGRASGEPGYWLLMLR